MTRGDDGPVFQLLFFPGDSRPPVVGWGRTIEIATTNLHRAAEARVETETALLIELRRRADVPA